MNKGKQTCRLLKEIRYQIAEANDIEYITSECRYKGDCTGTCPKCESEVRYLIEALEHRRAAGKAISLLGISASLLSAPAVLAAGTTEPVPEITSPTPDTLPTAKYDIVTVKGKVVDKKGEPISKVSITIEGTTLGAYSDSSGHFALYAPANGFLLFYTPGYGRQRIKVSRDMPLEIEVVLPESTETIHMGEMEGVDVIGEFTKRVETFISGGIGNIHQENPDSLRYLSGTITDKADKPLPGVEIWLIEKGKKPLFVDETDAKGNFEVTFEQRKARFKIIQEGYKTRQIRVRQKRKRAIHVTLKRDKHHPLPASGL